MALNIVFASSEATPFAKTGGLADVSGTLPAELKKLGCEVSLFLPFYREAAEKGVEIRPLDVEVKVPLGPRTITGRLYKAVRQGVPVYFLRRDEFFDRSNLYGTPEGDYFDNLERFVFFSRGVLEAVKALGLTPDVIHSNDWQTGLIPAYLGDTYAGDKTLRGIKTVLTIHNLAYQGTFPGSLFPMTGLSPALFHPEGVEFWGNVNFLKAGIVYSDAVTTVSRAYAREIQTPEYGHGLEGLLRKRSDHLYGVLNGVDYSEWDPETDTLIPSSYSADNLRGKSWCRRKLLKELGMEAGPGTPVIGVISRFAEQKGLDILCKAAPELAKRDLVLVILGSGEKKYQDLVEKVARRNPEKIAARVGFDNRMAHLMEAGSDMLLMPSRYEPCGLNQIYSLRYGTIPVVRATGGLDDTVRDLTADPAEGNGFKFRKYTARDLVRKVDEAVKAFGDKKAWREVQKRAMKEDFSWRNSASQYMDLYRKVLAPAPAGPKAGPAAPKPVAPPSAGGKPPSGWGDG